jgi:hypothetical protein
MTPSDYAAGVDRVRARLATLLAGTGRSPALVLDEWNVSGGGYDLRHDSAEAPP